MTTYEKPIHIVILGAGPAGLAAARYLSEHDNISVTLLESSDHIGGLMRSPCHEGEFFDVGTILFSNNHAMLDAFPFLLPKMSKIEYLPRSINPAGQLDRYPFSIKGFVKSFGILALVRCVLEILGAKLIYHRKDSVSSYAKYYMGNSFFARSGLSNYIERLHGLPHSDLDVTFAKLRLPMIERFSLRAVLLRAAGIGKTKKLIGGQKYVRPNEGFDSMYSEIRDYLIEKEVDIQTEVDVKRITKNNSDFNIETSTGTLHANTVISTIPLNTCCQLCGFPGNSAIKRTKGLISLFFLGKLTTGGNTIFNFTLAEQWKRLTLFSEFYGKRADKDFPDWFTVEVTTDNNTEEHAKALAESFLSHAINNGVVSPSTRLCGHFFTDNAYPLYTPEAIAETEKEKLALKNFGIELLGRQGNFEYVISNVVARRAKALSDAITSNH